MIIAAECRMIILGTEGDIYQCNGITFYFGFNTFEYIKEFDCSTWNLIALKSLYAVNLQIRNVKFQTHQQTSFLI